MMKTKLPTKRSGWAVPFVLLAVILNAWVSGTAQTYQKRAYADFQGSYRTGLYLLGVESVFGTLTNGSQAVDGNTRNASTLGIGAALLGAAEVTQFLQFTTNGQYNSPRNLPAGTAVHVKFTLPVSLVGLATNIEIGTFTDLKAVNKKITGALGTGPGNAVGYTAENMYSEYSGSTLLNAANGAGEVEVVMTPGQDFHGVYVKLSGDNLSLSLSASVFHAYILEEELLNCQEQDEVIDMLSGVRGNGALNIASATGSVIDAWNAIDDDPSESTFSIIRTGVQVLGQVYQTVVYNTPSRAGDSVRIVLQDVGGGVLDMDMLRGFTIQPYLSHHPVGDPIQDTNSLISLRLLQGAGNKYELITAIPVAFDRIEIIMGGVSDALKELRIYDMGRFRPAPEIFSHETNLTNDTLYVVEGNSVMLEATPADPTDEIRWYDAEGNLVGSGNSYFIPSVVKDGMYVARTARNGCVDNSSVHSVFLKTTPSGTLADHLLYFDARVENGATQISWKLVGHLTVDQYELLKSNDGIHFSSLAVLDANDKYASYQFTDDQEWEGAYYRLHMQSSIRRPLYSKIIYVQHQTGMTAAAGGRPFSIYPNPSNAEIRIILPENTSGMLRLEIRNQQGGLHGLKRVMAAPGQPLILTRPPNCPPGLYGILLYDARNQLIGAEKLLWR